MMLLICGEVWLSRTWVPAPRAASLPGWLERIWSRTLSVCAASELVLLAAALAAAGSEAVAGAAACTLGAAGVAGFMSW